MKRIKSIDTFRGWCLFMMIFGHMLSWWVRSEDRWLTSAIHSIFGDIIGTGFLFVSGLSAVLFFKSRLIKAEASEDINIEHVNNEYLFRALLILIAALIFNSITAIGTLNPLNIWKWYIPLTIAISLLFAFSTLKTPKWFRILLAVIIWIFHYYILSILLPYQGQIHVFGVLFHILYNSMGLHPILFYFSFFLIGTVVGDVIFEIYLIDNQKERRSQFKKKILLPLLTIGSILLLIAFLFLFPSFLLHATFSSTVYSLGTLFVSFSVLLIFEEYKVIKVEKSYRFFLFYSFYSFTIYFSHFILYFIFLNRLNAFNFWIAFFGTFILLTLLIRIVYKKYNIKASLKVQIARISLILVTRMEVKKKKKDRILLQSKT
ncbi:MAG: hypothetical protein CEE43_04745 [Promethearchaeota archaeon Loki_b32]|nr:MAG: hypothetical protein CEE43_04745 [Candidatus Lokiarchaeota archaeon Loki_b32]